VVKKIIINKYGLNLNSLFWLALFFLITSCGKNKISGRSHQIYINPSGNILDPVDDHEIKEDSRINYIKNVVDDFAKSGKNKIVIYFHGGLNCRSKAQEVAYKVQEKTNGDKSDIYPIFIQWDSGFSHNFGAHLFTLRRGDRIDVFSGVISSPYVIFEDVFKGIVRYPAALYSLFSGDFNESILSYSKKKKKSTNKKTWRSSHEEIKVNENRNKSIDYSIQLYNGSWVNGPNKIFGSSDGPFRSKLWEKLHSDSCIC
jgi:hypothetical protein